MQDNIYRNKDLKKVIHVPAYFSPVMKRKTKKVPTGEYKTGIFGGQKEILKKEDEWVQSGISKSEIDSARLAKDLEESIRSAEVDGFAVISVIPIISGSYNHESKIASGGTENKGYGGYGYGYGYSYTDSLLVLCSKDT